MPIFDRHFRWFFSFYSVRIYTANDGKLKCLENNDTKGTTEAAEGGGEEWGGLGGCESTQLWGFLLHSEKKKNICIWKKCFFLYVTSCFFILLFFEFVKYASTLAMSNLLVDFSAFRIAWLSLSVSNRILQRLAKQGEELPVLKGGDSIQ